jgi:hypothetical protein
MKEEKNEQYYTAHHSSMQILAELENSVTLLTLPLSPSLDKQFKFMLLDGSCGLHISELTVSILIRFTNRHLGKGTGKINS